VQGTVCKHVDDVLGGFHDEEEEGKVGEASSSLCGEVKMGAQGTGGRNQSRWFVWSRQLLDIFAFGVCVVGRGQEIMGFLEADDFMTAITECGVPESGVRE
jgi:hypothetical protein